MMRLNDKKKIVIGFDGSEGSWKALKEAAKLATNDKAQLYLVSIEELPSFPTTMGEVVEEQESSSSHLYKLQRQAMDELLATGYDANNLVNQIKVGHPAKGLVDYAAAVSADLLVIGHSGHSGVWGSFLGTTADKVVRHASCSVLVVR
jgi:nucleotide-binding universal stress UspA family protein